MMTTMVLLSGRQEEYLAFKKPSLYYAVISLETFSHH